MELVCVKPHDLLSAMLVSMHMHDIIAPLEQRSRDNKKERSYKKDAYFDSYTMYGMIQGELIA